MSHLRKATDPILFIIEEFWPILLIGLLSIGFIALAIWVSIAESQACTDKGGHIITKPAVGPAVGGQGGIAITSVSFCISEDGRILG